VTRKPTLDHGMPMVATVIENQVHLRTLGDSTLDHPQKTEGIMMPVVSPALRHDLPIGDIQAVTSVLVLWRT
jgi:hypothetical protein